MDELNNLWNSTPAATKSDNNDPDPETDPTVPDGEYDAEILDWRAFLSKKGVWCMKWVMEIRGSGLLAGRTLVRFAAVTAKSTPYVKSDIVTCLGREAEWDGDLVDVSRGLSGPARTQFRGVILRVRKRTRVDNQTGDTYLDVYINGCVSRPESASPPPEIDPRDPSGEPVDMRGFEPTEEPPRLPSQPSRDAVPFPTDLDAPLHDDEDEIPF